MEKTEIKDQAIQELFEVGAQYTHKKSKRHPSVKSFIFGAKNNIELFDLYKTSESLEKALKFVQEIAKKKGNILFVGGKNEAHVAVKNGADRADMPYIIGRWVGGILTNFEQIRKRVDRLQSLRDQKEKGDLSKYTKKERLLIDREIEKLERMFGGIVDMQKMPDAVFVVDAGFEEIAVDEASQRGIPVIAICGSDCNLKKIDYPIPANDSSVKSITYFINKIVETIKNTK